jgi:hypothetical protein
MRLIFSFLLLLTTVIGLSQQQADSSNWKYTATVSGGLIIGAQEPSYLVQTLHGIQKGPWMIALGAGIDYYIIRSVPIVAHGQYHLKGKRASSPYLYAQAGPALTWANNEWIQKFQNQDIYTFKTGWLAESGMGFQFPMGKKLKGFTSFGYSFRQANYQERQLWWIGPWPTPQDVPANYTQQKLNMLRAVLKLGLQL